MEINNKHTFGEYDYEVTQMTLLNMQVCSNCPPEKADELESAVQLHTPSGTTANWNVIKDGKLKPVDCENGGR